MSEKKEGFRTNWLGNAGIVFYILAAIGLGAWAMNGYAANNSQAQGQLVGEAMGGIFGGVIIGMIVGSVAYRVCGRSQGAGNIALCVVLLLAFGGQYQRLMNTRASLQMQAQIESLQAQARSDFEAGDMTGSRDVERFEQLRRSVDDASKNMSGDEAKLMRAASELVGEQQKALAAYSAASGQLTGSPLVDFANVKEIGQLDELDKLVADFMKANDEFDAVMQNSPDRLGELARKHGVPEPLIAATLREAKSNSANLALQKKIRHTDRQLGQALLDASAVLRKHWGKWTVNPILGLVFEPESVPQEDGAAFYGAMGRLQQSAVDQEKFQRLLLQAQ